MSDDSTDLLAALGRATAAMEQQWRHRFQQARRETQSTASERGMLNSSIRFSIEGNAIASATEELIPEILQLVEDHLKGATTAADLPSPEQILQATEPLMHSLIEDEIADLRAAAKRTALTADINDGAIAAAITNIKPALATLSTRIQTALQNRKAELITAQSMIDAAAPTTKPKSPLQRLLEVVSVARSLWWLFVAIIGIGLWVWNGFSLPF